MDNHDTWVCGDCKHEWPISRYSCQMAFDDYLGLHRLKSIDEAIHQAIIPSLDKFDEAIYRVQNGIPRSSVYYRRTNSGTLMTVILAA